MQQNRTSVPQSGPNASGLPTNGQPYDFNRLLQGVFIPRAVMACTNICPGARLLWGLLRAYSRKHGATFASDDTLARRLAVTGRQLRSYCKQLESAGLLRSTARPGHTTLRELLWAPIFSGPVAILTPEVNFRGGGRILPGGWKDPSTKLNNLRDDLSSSSVCEPSSVGDSGAPPIDDDERPTELKPYPTREQRAFAHGYFQVMLKWPQNELAASIERILKLKDVEVADYLSVMWNTAKNLTSPPRNGIWLKIAKEIEPRS